MKSRKMLTILVVVLVLAISAIGNTQGKMYWTNFSTDKIQRANMDGSGVEDLVTTGLSNPYLIALDVTGGKMYWTNAGTNKIQRANLDGTGVEDVITSGLSNPRGIALDVTGAKMYWTDWGSDKIQRANLDGSAVEDLVITGLINPDGIALDVAGGKMYWTDYVTDKIHRANMDGSGVEDLVTGLSYPLSIALDVTGAKMYWTDWGSNKIQRANLDGSAVEDLLTGLSDPSGIALDVTAGKMYWTDYGTDKIHRANLDGSGVEDLVTGLGNPHGIAIALAPIISAFTYQGRLMDANHVADGEYDFQFKLYDDPNVIDGNQVGSDVNVADVDVIEGYFTVELDFGSDVFDGDCRWLEIGVRPGELNDPNVYTTLSPRQELTPTPYAIYAKTAGYAETAGGAADGITGSGTANYIPKFTGLNTLGDSAIYEEAGNVGVGTTSPGTNKLKVVGNIDATGFTEGGSNTLSNDISGNAATASDADTVDSYHYSSTWPTTLGNIQSACSNNFHNIGGTDDDVPDSDGEVPDNISINNTRLYAPAGAGNVGIGTTNPDDGKLEVNGEISTGHGGLRWKLFSGTTGSSILTFSHGLNASKIYSISCILRDGPNGWGLAQEFRGYEHNVYSFEVRFDDTRVYIQYIGTALDDADDTYRCIVWYVDDM